MKPKFYCPENIPCVKVGTPTITILKSGSIHLSATLINKIELAKDDKIMFVQDEEIPTDWYIRKSENKSGFILREKNYKGKVQGLTFNNAYLCRIILGNFVLNGKQSIRFYVNTDPVKVGGLPCYKMVCDKSFITLEDEEATS